MNTFTHSNELKAARAFNKQSAVFDDLYQHDTIIAYKRERVRNHLLQFVQEGQRILELNSGTGEDAAWLASRGFYVHATDISPGMQEKLTAKIDEYKLQPFVTNELCSFNNLASLKDRGPFHALFSNFAGLNCTDKLSNVLESFDTLLLPGGYATLVLLPKFCLWESLLLLKGKFKTATRRWFRAKSIAHVEGEYFDCTYYNPSYLIKYMSPNFKLVSLEGLCTIVPPSYMQRFAEKHPRIFVNLSMIENRLRMRWPWKYIGDYYIITFQKQ